MLKISATAVSAFMNCVYRNRLHCSIIELRGRKLEAVNARNCSKITCNQPAVATLTASYADRIAVIGPLSPEPQNGQSDLCAEHAANFVAPQSWKVLLSPKPLEPQDDLLALAKALSNETDQGRLNFSNKTPAEDLTENKPQLRIIKDQ